MPANLTIFENITKIYLNTNLNSLVCIKLNLSLKHSHKENSRSRWLPSEFYQTVKKEILPNLCKHFWKIEKGYTSQPIV